MQVSFGEQKVLEKCGLFFDSGNTDGEVFGEKSRIDGNLKRYPSDKDKKWGKQAEKLAQ